MVRCYFSFNFSLLCDFWGRRARRRRSLFLFLCHLSSVMLWLVMIIVIATASTCGRTACASVICRWNQGKRLSLAVRMSQQQHLGCSRRTISRCKIIHHAGSACLSLEADKDHKMSLFSCHENYNISGGILFIVKGQITLGFLSISRRYYKISSEWGYLNPSLLIKTSMPPTFIPPTSSSLCKTIP